MAKELQKELTYFEATLEEMLTHSKGQFALIKGDQLLGTFSEFDKAVEHGVNELGNTPFLVRMIVERQIDSQSPALNLGLLYASP